MLWDAKDKPAGITSGMIETWLSGRVTTAKPGHYAYVLARWSALPDMRHVPLTQAMSDRLKAELVRVGLGPVMLMRRLKQRPSGLTRHVIEGWAEGAADDVDETGWNYLIARLGQLPDGKPGTDIDFSVMKARRAITENELTELRSHRERTGFGGAILLRHAGDIPPGLTPAMISNWLSGNAKTAYPEHIITYSRDTERGSDRAFRS